MGNICLSKKKKYEKNSTLLEIRLKSKNDLIKKESVNLDNMEKHLNIPLSYSEKKIREIYNIEDKIIGEGHFGKVKIGCFKDSNYRKFAIKLVKRDVIKDSIYLIANELNIIRTLDHLNIIKFYETYFNKKYIYFVTELCEGKTLEDEIIRNKRISEKVAKEYVFQLLLSLNHLHFKKIVHRDIKAENVLFLKSNKKLVKLTDFGLSKMNHIDKMSTLVGTPYYVAPEVLKNNYSLKCDSWSMGILMFYMLSGDYPFESAHSKDLFKLIKKGNFEFKNKCWNKISNEAKEIIKEFLIVDPNFRLSISNAIDKKWFYEINTKYLNEGKEILLKNNFISNMLNFNIKSIFKKEVLKLAVNLYDNDLIIHKLKKAYFYLDYLNNGCIAKNELTQFLDEEKIEYTEEKIINLLKDLNLNSENYITYTEFIIACIDIKDFLNKTRIRFLYNRFNIDNSDAITLNNLKECFSRFGFLYGDNKLQSMIDEFDYLHNNKITFEEFSNKLLN